MTLFLNYVEIGLKGPPTSKLEEENVCVCVCTRIRVCPPPPQTQFICVSWPYILLSHQSVRAHLVGVCYEQISVTRCQNGVVRWLCQHWDSIPRNWTSSSIIQQKLLKRYICYLMCRKSCHPLIKKKKKERKPSLSVNNSLKEKIVIQKKLLFTLYRELEKDSLLIQCTKILIIDLSCNHYFRQFIQLNWL